MNLVMWIGGIAVGAVVSFGIGWLLRSRLATTRLGDAERQAQIVVEAAQREAESAKRAAILEAKEDALKLRQQAERENQQARSTQLATERAFQEKEAAFNRRVELIEKKDRDLKRSEQELGQREAQVQQRTGQLDTLFQEQTVRLERVAGMSADEARAQLLTSIESEARAEASRRVQEIRESAQRNAEREARKIITPAIQRYAGDQVSESSVSVVHLPSDEIGRAHV